MIPRTTLVPLARAVALAVAFAAPGGALAQTAPAAKPGGAGELSLELNKLEAVAPACRAYFVVTSRLPEVVRELRLDVFLFDKAGIVQRRVAMAFPDLRPDRAKVVLFDLPETACGDVGRFLVNDVLACTTQAGTALAGCAAALKTSTRAGAELAY